MSANIPDPNASDPPESVPHSTPLLSLEQLNPKFKAWFAEQPADLQAEILAYWEETATHPEIAHQAPMSVYTRATFVVNRCMERHGFDPWR